LLEEAEKRDHRKLGQELELFMFDDEVGQGLPLWLPKGALLRHLVMTFAFNTYLQRGYEPVSTPHIASLKLWQHSGHLDFYKENLYNPFGIEDEEYMIKPMNCPFHVQMYKFKKKSYRDLPIRWTEMGTVYRYEKSGTLHGLTRVRGFTQDDAHMICTPEQLHDELLEALKLTIYILNSFGFKDFEVNLSVRDPENKEKFIGRDEDWERAEGELKNVLAEAGFKDFVYDVGGAVFYGPKIDVKVKDALGRPWQLSTIQFDFNLPARFNMTYQGADGQEHTPFMIHRALLGSLERFLGVLIEHYGGAFPVWLSPVQIKIISVSEKHIDYCNKLKEEFKEADLRPEVDDKNETVDNKIRKALEEKVPYILVVGDKEMNGDILTVRDRGETKTREIKKEEFLEEVKKKIENKE
jgi:threonyl-tRNA synthetase